MGTLNSRLWGLNLLKIDVKVFSLFHPKLQELWQRRKDLSLKDIKKRSKSDIWGYWKEKWRRSRNNNFKWLRKEWLSSGNPACIMIISPCINLNFRHWSQLKTWKLFRKIWKASMSVQVVVEEFIVICPQLLLLNWWKQPVGDKNSSHLLK